MKNLLRYLIAIVFLFSQYVIIAQNTEIKWSPNIQKTQPLNVIGEFDNHLYALPKDPGFLKDSKVNFYKIDKKTLKRIEEHSMKSIVTKTNILYSKVNEDKVEFLVLREKGIRIIVCDLELNEISNEEVIKFEKKPILKVIFGYNKSSKVYRHTITSNMSKDESKIVVKLEKPSKKEIDVEYHMFDASAGYNYLYSQKLGLSKKPNFQQIKDENIGSDGSLNLLVKKYNSKKQKESQKKKPNYKYKILKIEAEDKITEVELPDQINFWLSPKIVKNNNGVIAVSALIIEKPKRDAKPKGINFINIDQEDNIVINEIYDLGSDEENLEKYESCDIVDFIAISDSLFIVISEKMEIGLTNLNSTEIWYDLGNIIFEGFNNEGKHLWSNTIHRNVGGSQTYALFSKFKIFQNDEELSLFYLTKRNTDILNIKNQKPESLSGRKNTIIKANLSKNGEFTFDKILTSKKLVFCPYYIHEINDSFYLNGSTDNHFKKSSFGALYSK